MVSERLTEGETSLDLIRIVLIDTRHPGNIGATARAMKNMGLKHLYLVDPKLYPDPQAKARAASAEDILDNAVVCDTLSQAIDECVLVVGSSARERRIPWPLFEARVAAERVIEEAKSLARLTSESNAPIAILFGREDRGLTNEELQRCNYHMTIPTCPVYSSLNLASAVQVFSYELRMAAHSFEQDSKSALWDVPPAAADDLERYYQHLKEVLSKIEFIDVKAPRQVMVRFRRLYNRIRPDQMELAMLRGMLTQIEKKISSSKTGSQSTDT